MSPLPATIPAPVRTRIRADARRRTVPTPDAAERRALLLRLLSLLLRYPDHELTDGRPRLTAAVAALPPSRAGAELAAFMAWFTAEEPEELVRHHAGTFDPRRDSSLHLTHYLNGDLRRRGMALLALKQRYRAAGWEPEGAEPPDHLPVVLEFAALAGPGRGEAPLRQHRRGLELIHRTLTDIGSPYHHLLAALCTLPPPPAEDTEPSPGAGAHPEAER
ncbi:nitrate reductase molybdenum cofactor assembly chaperone [Streptomyces sp. NPDC058954]|uniref:nitrate reductase molybdenum cofactor assembly chaperone n=1 Tax=Streptomyces sp. NPDC058954 TaxID=3346677 RepID=UPI0036A4DBE8